MRRMLGGSLRECWWHFRGEGTQTELSSLREGRGRKRRERAQTLDNKNVVENEINVINEKISNDDQFQGDLSFVVEVCNNKPDLINIKHIDESPIFLPLYRVKEKIAFLIYYSCIIFDCDEYIVSGFMHKCNYINVLSLTQLLNITTSIESPPLTISSSKPYLPSKLNKTILCEYSDIKPHLTKCLLKYPIKLLVPIKNLSWNKSYNIYINNNQSKLDKDSMKHSDISCNLKKKDVVKEEVINQSIKCYTSSGLTLSMRPKERYRWSCTSVGSTSITHASRAISERYKNTKETIPNMFKSYFIKNKILNNSNNQYKDFLQKWKMRKSKYQEFLKTEIDVTDNDQRPYSGFQTFTSSHTNDSMITFVNEYYKNLPVTSTNIVTEIRDRRKKSTNNSNFSIFQNRSLSNEMTRIMNITTNYMYEEVLSQMIVEVIILINIFGNKIFHRKLNVQQSLETYSSTPEPSAFINEYNRSLCITSNSMDYTESTACDIVSNQAYSADSTLLMST